MVELGVYQTVTIVFTGVSISLAAFYYISVLSTTQKTQQITLETRQTQLFMNLFIYHLNYNFNEQAARQLLEWEWEDFENFDIKFGLKSNPEAWTWWTLIMNWFEGIGILAESNLVDIDVINKWVGAWFKSFWEKYEPIVIEYRTHLNRPTFYKNLGELYTILKAHPST